MVPKFLLPTTFVFIVIFNALEGTKMGFCCDNGCHTDEKYCDSESDCGDNTDESHCGYQLTCLPNQFHCANGNCILYDWYCDGENDCEDNSDESDCRNRWPCLPNRFRCLNNKCIFRDWYCDGEKDCEDNSDESDCRNGLSCLHNELPCLDGKCIPLEWHCDGFKDCRDNSDESDCNSPARRIKTFPGVSAAINKLTRYFLRRRSYAHSINKWGPHLLKTAVSLFYADSNFFAPNNKTGEEIAYEVSIQLMSKLALKKQLSTKELSLFINAMTVSCIDPKDFFGVNLVSELRNRVNNSNYTNPFTFLTLCNAGDTMISTDLTMLRSIFNVKNRPLWTDTQALAAIAMACISAHSNADFDADELNNMVDELIRKQHKNGTIDNVKTTALVLQALISTKSNRANFDLDAALKLILHQINNATMSYNDMYYILPMLNSKSMLNISSSHCVTPVTTELEILNKLNEKMEKRIQVQFSAYIWDKMDLVRTWKLKVSSNDSFYQLLENIGWLDPHYKVKYSISEDRKPYVVGLGSFSDNAEDGLFWFTYVQNLKNSTDMRLLKESPVDVSLNEDEELILWYRTGTWADSAGFI